MPEPTIQLQAADEILEVVKADQLVALQAILGPYEPTN